MSSALQRLLCILMGIYISCTVENAQSLANDQDAFMAALRDVQSTRMGTPQYEAAVATLERIMAQRTQQVSLPPPQTSPSLPIVEAPAYQESDWPESNEHSTSLSVDLGNGQTAVCTTDLTQYKALVQQAIAQREDPNAYAHAQDAVQRELANISQRSRDCLDAVDTPIITSQTPSDMDAYSHDTKPLRNCLMQHQDSTLKILDDWHTWTNTGWKWDSRCEPSTYAIVPDPVDSTNRVLQVTNTFQPCGTGANGHASARTEVVGPFTVDYQQDFVWVQRIYVPQDWPGGGYMPASQWATVMQVIPGNRTAGWKPDFKLRLHGNGRFIWDGPGRGSWPARRGAWQTIVIYFRRSVGADGIADVWADGEQRVHFRGPTTWIAEDGGLWKFGIYSFVHAGTAPARLYFDDTAVGIGTDLALTCRPASTP